MSQVINKATGEVFEINNLAELITAWRDVSNQIKALEATKELLKKQVSRYTDELGRSEEIDGYWFTTTSIQRKTYDKTVLREVLDEDTYDLFMKPDKSAIDNYLKENIETLGDVSRELRTTMIEDGRPYTVIKLESLTRKDK